MHDINALKKMFDSFQEAIYIVDKDRKILYFNPVAEKISGFLHEDVENSFCYDNILNHIDESGNSLCKNGCPLSDTIKYNKIEDYNVYLHHKDGHRVGVHVRTIPHYDPDGKVDGAIEVFSLLNDSNLLLEELKIKNAYAFTDAVTDAFNRHYLNTEIEHVLKQNDDKKVGVVFVDIDKFKRFNDNYGHDVGDAVLLGVCRSIVVNIPKSDAVIRYGGDEFVIIMFGLTDEELIARTKRIGVLIKGTTIRKNNKEYSVSASLGLAFKKEDEFLSQTITRADEAMYKVKRNKDGNVVIIDK